ncbi:translational GTPase TypA [Desulfovermiculus halophilus]|uniref:translational GTPase TypA n=1 Tax=Desulfovermiculus halophilus TaxID=339722 RepID=UPI000485387C|nr:translational GTPase TypA [Desulfovermiculus halophilus]
MQSKDIRNIAIIAHVDHGKTTLVDAMFRQSGLFREGQEVAERLMDTMDLEQERGITIAAKNSSVMWEGVKINIVDTPGHADFGGEVERALSMADGALLLVDASEGPLPQTRFVLEKTLAAGLKVVVLVNKIDRQDARSDEVLNEVYDLFIDLGANDEQIDFPYLFAIGRDGVAGTGIEDMAPDLRPLFETIVRRMPAPAGDPKAPFQMLVSDLGYSDYLGRLAIGKVANGEARTNDHLVCLGPEGQISPLRVTRLQTFEGMSLQPAEHIQAGDICVLSGIEDIHIGDTICHQQSPQALQRVRVDEPTVGMRFTINTSPLAGREGSLVQSGKIRERLFKETLKNVSLQVEEVENRETFLVKGRGEFQMAILIETMRREGFELTVGRPEVLYKEENGQILEPMEQVIIDCDQEFTGVITEKLSGRKGKMVTMNARGSGRVRMEFSLPSRGLIGYRDEFLTDTRGSGLLNTYFAGYEPYRGAFASRSTGSIVSDRFGSAVAYALFNLEPRGEIFIVPGDAVYEGMIFGEHNRPMDLNANPCKEKKLTNVRAAGRDENVTLTPVRPMTLERAIHFIREDEMVEVTPKSIRLRKSVLSAQKRQSMRPSS